MKLEIAICQLIPRIGDSEINARTVIRTIEDGDQDVSVFPEMFLSGYGSSPPDDCERLLGTISDACRSCGKAAAVGAAMTGENGKRNVLAFLSPDGDVLYDKIHLARFGLYSEEGYVAGNGPAIGRYKGIGFGLSVCYDAFFPEVMHCCALDGAEIMVCASASAIPSLRYFRRVLPARALENVSYLVYVNNTGTLSGLEMGGGSSAYDPLGNTLIELGREESVARIVFDTDTIAEARAERHHIEDFRKDIAWPLRHQTRRSSVSFIKGKLFPELGSRDGPAR